MPDLPPVHKPKWAEALRRKNDVARAKRNQDKRCYKTSSRTWRKLRADVLRHEPLCRKCAEEGRLTPANEVDHIDRNTFNNSLDNLAALCKPCHSKKSNAERKA